MTEPKTYERATIYRCPEFGMGYRAYRVRNLTITYRRYAQYENAVELRFIPKGKRRERVIMETYKPTTVVVEGWDAPLYDVSPFDRTGPMTAKSRHTAFSEGWGEEFENWLAAEGIDPSLDLRGHNSYRG